MANTLDVKLVIKHLTNGTLSESLCIICLLPLTERYENIFTEVCKENGSYCIAEVMETLADIKFTDAENFNVCINCFKLASDAYKFYHLTKRNYEILNIYTDMILGVVEKQELIKSDINTNSLCLSLPYMHPGTQPFEYDIQGLGLRNNVNDAAHITVKKEQNTDNVRVNKEQKIDMAIVKKPPIKTVKKEHIVDKITVQKEFILDKVTVKKEPKSDKITVKKEHNADKVTIKQENHDNDDIVMVINDNGEPSFYKISDDGTLILLDIDVEKQKQNTLLPGIVTGEKKKRKFKSMPYKDCDRCPMKYHFMARLKDHMRTEHNVELFVCKLCKFTTEDESIYVEHQNTQHKEYECEICAVTFRNRGKIIKHLQRHHVLKKIDEARQSEAKDRKKRDAVLSVAEMERSALPPGSLCGFLRLVTAGQRKESKLSSEKKPDNKATVQKRDDMKFNNFTCYYCGRLYKSETAFDRHIKKHEVCLQAENSGNEVKTVKIKESEKKCVCSTCGRLFVDERALLWHQRLHNGERPYVCDVCGRGFVCAARRAAHARTAHAAAPPARACPLCPARFYMSSMVTNHIKKVHLAPRKRRRPHPYKHTTPPTPVPIQELAVEVQHRVLELQEATRKQNMEITYPEGVEDAVPSLVF